MSHGLLVIIPEIVTKEEVTVFVVRVNWYLKTSSLCTTFARNGLTFWILLRYEGLYFQFAEFQIGFYTEQWTTTTNEAIVQVHGYITSFDGLDNVIFLTLIVHLEIDLIKTERCFGIVAHVKVEFVTHFTIDIYLNFFVKIKDVIIARAFGQCWVIHVLMLKAKH